MPVNQNEIQAVAPLRLGKCACQSVLLLLETLLRINYCNPLPTDTMPSKSGVGGGIHKQETGWGRYFNLNTQ